MAEILRRLTRKITAGDLREAILIQELAADCGAQADEQAEANITDILNLPDTGPPNFLEEDL